MSLSNYLENALLDHVLGNTTFTQPTDVYVKLHTGDPGEAGTSNAATETTRKSAAFNAASSGSAALTSTLTWTSVSTTETYTHISLWDNVSAGNCLGAGALSAPAAMTAGDTFNLTALTVSLD